MLRVDAIPSEAAPSAASLIKGVIHLVSLPEICLRIVEKIGQEDCSNKDLAELISQDPAIAVRLLRVVNSSLFLSRGRIETISRAVTMLGFRELKDLVLATSAAGVFEKIPSELSNMDQFWRHGVLCGILSQQIARRSNVLHAERLFVAGLLHDIGRLIMYFKIPEQEKAALEIARTGAMPLYQAEQLLLGFTHADVGGELMSTWGLSDSHCACARFHHTPGVAGRFVLDAAVVHLADALTRLADGEMTEQQVFDIVDPATWDVLPVRSHDYEDLIQEARQQFLGVLTLFQPGAVRSQR